MRKSPLVTIVIPVKKVNHFLRESIKYLNELDWPNFEILIIPDQEEKVADLKRATVVASGAVGPAEKRDLVIMHGKGEFFAFIDDDAFPQPQWLKKAIENFADPQVAAVGGPGVTPPNVPFLEKVSGWVSASPIGAGPYTYRFLPGKKKFVDDYPSMNLIVRREDFIAVGGFDSHYYPGEDTKLCLDLINRGKKIVYEPEAIVYHHRRPLWWPHLRQNGNFGIHRGFFARKLPKTSLRLSYLLPSLLVLNLIAFVLAVLFFPQFEGIFAISIGFYLFALLANAAWVVIISNDVAVGIVSVPAVFLTHVWYGIRFVQGYIFTRHLRQ
jgi:cellulose synthase/poly-beta-1,6-N-acetylglucosamine synthase-like glycosyltransferase